MSKDQSIKDINDKLYYTILSLSYLDSKQSSKNYLTDIQIQVQQGALFFVSSRDRTAIEAGVIASAYSRSPEILPILSVAINNILTSPGHYLPEALDQFAAEGHPHLVKWLLITRSRLEIIVIQDLIWVPA